MRPLVALFAVASALALASLFAAEAASQAAGTLALDSILTFTWGGTNTCPAGTPPQSTCIQNFARTTISGLGSVALADTTVISQPDSGNPNCYIWSISGRLFVTRRGAIDFEARNPACQHQQTADLSYTFTGGSDVYTGASGTGTLSISNSNEYKGTMHWTGTLVASTNFDTTPPTIQGAKNKTVRAKTKAGVPVSYVVTASDAVDGFVQVVCTPRSGKVFRVGKTVVSCTANDRSGNVAHARFTVTVVLKRKHR
jgi:hypothetical protein